MIITYLQPTKQGEGCERSPLPTQHWLWNTLDYSVRMPKNLQWPTGSTWLTLHLDDPGWSWMILKCRRPSVIPKVPALLWALQVCVCLDDRAISRNWRSQVWLLLGLWLGARSGSEPSEPVISRFFTTLWDLCHNLCHILSQDTGWKWPGPNI